MTKKPPKYVRPLRLTLSFIYGTLDHVCKERDAWALAGNQKRAARIQRVIDRACRTFVRR